VGMVADVLHLPFEPASFDVVVSNSTLDHFDSLDAVGDGLSELSRVLRPGLVPYELGVTCGRRRLIALLDRAGFDVEATEAIMHCPPQVAGKLAERLGGDGSAATLQDDHLRRVLRFEALGRWPTRYLTAHFVAAWAIRRSPGGVSAR
jgi:SAM-dependent methyltransferase